MNLDRRNHVLRAKPMSNKTSIHVLAFYDVESYVDSKERQHPYLLCAKYIFTDRNFNIIGDEISDTLLWEDRHLFIEKLIGFAENINVKVSAFAHNHQYDLFVNNGEVLEELKDDDEYTFIDEKGNVVREIYQNSLIDILTSSPYDYRVFQMNLKAPKFFELGKKGNHVKGMINYTKNPITFIDSMNYFNTSVEKIGKSIGMDKGKLDHTVDRRGKSDLIAEAAEYCMNDVNIIAYAVIRFLMITSPNHKVPKSTPSAVFNMFTEKYLKPDVPIYCHDKKKALRMELDSYVGARTEVYLQDKKEFIYSLDVNSLYPSEMKDNKYPTKIVSESTSISVGQQEKMITGIYNILKNKDNRTAIVDVLVDIPKNLKISPIPVKLVGERERDSRLVFPVGQFTTTLAGPEFMLAVELGYVKKLFAYVLYETSDIFSEFINDMYQERLNASDSGLQYEADLYKTFMNSLSGKFGQNMKMKIYLGEEEDQSVRFGLKHEGPDRNEVQVFANSKFGYSDHKIAYDAVPAIPSHVNSYARVRMWKLMEKAGFQNILYIDNDGIKVNEEGYRNLKDEIDSKELGKLKLEYTGYLTAYVAKDYRIDEAKDANGNYITNNPDGVEGVIVKMKGVPPSAKKVEELLGKDVYVKTKFSTAYDAMRDNGVQHFRTEQVFVTRNLMLHGRYLAQDGHTTIPLELTPEIKSYSQINKDKERRQKEQQRVVHNNFDYGKKEKPKGISIDFRKKD